MAKLSCVIELKKYIKNGLFHAASVGLPKHALTLNLNINLPYYITKMSQTEGLKHTSDSKEAIFIQKGYIYKLSNKKD